jgi:hypothetical protein
VSKHGQALKTDVNTVTRLLASLNANLDAVSSVLSATPVLVAGANLDSKVGLVAAYDPKYHRIDLRAQLTPTVQALLNALGFPLCASVPGSGPQANCPPATGSTAAPPPASAGPPAAPGPPVNPSGPTTTILLPCVPIIPIPLPSTTTTTQPCIPIPTTLPVTIPPLPTLPTVPPLTPHAQPDMTLGPPSTVTALLGSPGTAGHLPQSAYGSTPDPTTTQRGGVLSHLAQWSHDLLENLW